MNGKGKIKLALALLLIILIGVTIKPSFRMKVKRPFYSFLKPAQESFETANSFLLSLNEVVVNFNEWQKRVEQLEREKMNLLAENVELREVKEENKTLREAMDMELGKDYNLKLARVAGRRFEQQQLVLNKGEKDGIEQGMPVISSEKVVVGEIVEVGDNTSRVKLISHPDISFSAHLKDEKMEAEVKGQGNFGVKLDFIPVEQKIESGQVVVTSSLGGVYPVGLLVGEVKEVEQRDVKPFQVAEVKPYFEPNSDFLFVITSVD